MRELYYGQFEDTSSGFSRFINGDVFNQRRLNVLLEKTEESYEILSFGLIEVEDWMFYHCEELTKYFSLSILAKLQPLLITGIGETRKGREEDWKTSRPNIMGDYGTFVAIYPERDVPPEMFSQLIWKDFLSLLYIPRVSRLRGIIVEHLLKRGNFIYYG